MRPPNVSFQPLPDVVLQCSGCKTILGDTREFVCTATVEEAKLLVLSAGTEVSVDRIPQSTTVEGVACTHFPVCCCGCGGVVGRMYTRPPAGLDALLNAFAMEAERCSSVFVRAGDSSYRLGSADVRVAGGQAAQQAAASAEGVRAQQQQQGRGQQADAAVMDLLGRVEALESELLKMQGMILLHDQQLQALPSYPSANGGAGGGDAGGIGGVDAGMMYGQPSLAFPTPTLALGTT